jgi:hypothetical protein
MKTLINKEDSDFYMANNNVSIRDVLDGIFIFHECQKWYGHPYIELHSDGSGRVIIPQDGKEIFTFSNLEEFVAETKRLENETN